MHEQDFAAVPAVLTFTVDVEDHRESDAAPPRYERMTHRLLDLLDEWRASGTFFVVGEVAERTPGLVREIAWRGHEIGCHGHRHVPLTRLDAASLRRDLARAKWHLEDLAGAPVLGFRAPLFSLTAATLWAVDVIAETGFAYSSSVLPARGFAFGFPGMPADPFLWPGGLLELPCPLGRVGPFRLPCLGGMYLRYLPRWRLRQLARALSTDVVWTYCHPYDFDTTEPLTASSPYGRVAGFFLWWNREVMLHRMSVLMRGRRSISFRDRLAEVRASAASAPLIGP